MFSPRKEKSEKKEHCHEDGGGGSVVNPKSKRRFSLVNDAASQMEGVPIGGKDAYTTKLSYGGKLSHRNMLSEPKYANVAIEFPCGRVLCAHDYILRVRAPEFYKLVAAKKHRRKKVTVIEWKDFDLKLQEPYSAFLVVLPFVYIGEISEHSATIEAAIDVSAAARRLQLPRLESVIEHWMADHLNAGNMHFAIMKADEQNAFSAKDLAIRYAHKHIKEFVDNKAAAAEMGVQLFHEVVALRAQYEMYKEPGEVNEVAEGEVGQSLVVENYKNMYITLQTDPTEGDCHVIVRGEKFKFHRAILEAHSRVFSAALQRTNKGDNEEMGDCMEMEDDVTADAIRTLLRFVYYGYVPPSAHAAISTVGIARRLMMSDLEQLCHDKMRDVTTDNVLQILELMVHARTQPHLDLEKFVPPEEIYSGAIKFAVDHITEINLDSLQRMDPSIMFTLLKEVQKKEKAVASNSGSSVQIKGIKPPRGKTPRGRSPRPVSKDVFEAKPAPRRAKSQKFPSSPESGSSDCIAIDNAV